MAIPGTTALAEVTATTKAMAKAIKHSLAIPGATAMAEATETTMATAKATTNSVAIPGATALALATESTIAMAEATTVVAVEVAHRVRGEDEGVRMKVFPENGYCHLQPDFYTPLV